MAPGHSDDVLERWPATLHPDRAERCYYAQRQQSRAWVDGLFTRSGTPRWYRILRCGDPELCIRGAECSWQHLWCRDRACYACARSRSRRLATSLRSACETRTEGSRYFVTLTRPKQHGESAGVAWSRFVRAWERLRKTRAWALYVVGGVRTVEATWSEGHAHTRRRFGGWHVHAHVLFELRSDACGDERVACPACDGTTKRRGVGCRTCGGRYHRADGTLPRAASELLLAWLRIVDGDAGAQNAVPLRDENVGQLAKYLTKLWELPAGKARELFEGAAGRRITEGFGEWRRWRRWGEVEREPSGWVASGIRIREIEALDRSDLLQVDALLPGASMRPLRDGLGGKGSNASVRAACAPFADDDADDLPFEYGAPLPELSCTRLSGDALAQHYKRNPPKLRIDVPAWRPRTTIALVSAGHVLDALRRDDRPVWERGDADAATAAIVAAQRRVLSERSREEYRGHVSHNAADARRRRGLSLAQAGPPTACED